MPPATTKVTIQPRPLWPSHESDKGPANQMFSAVVPMVVKLKPSGLGWIVTFLVAGGIYALLGGAADRRPALVESHNV